MICDVCKSEENSIDDRLGETVCDDCGYVMVSDIFEETSSPIIKGTEMAGHEEIRTGDRGMLGSDIGYSTHGMGNSKLIRSLRKNQQMLKDRATQNMGRGMLECNMVLSPWLPNSNLKDRVHAYYKKFFLDRHTHRWTVSSRATAIVFIVLKENGIAITINELCEANRENKLMMSKAARYFARNIGKPWLLHQMSAPGWVDKCGNTLVYLNGYNHTDKRRQEFIADARVTTDYISQQLDSRDIYFSKGYLACCFWITCLLRTRGSWPEYTQGEICMSCNCTEMTLRDNMRKLYIMLNTNKQSLKQLRVEQFVAGVRYG